MNRWIVPGFGGAAAAAAVVALWQAGAQTPAPTAPASAVPAPAVPAPAASFAAGEDWGSPDGGAVVIKPGGGSYSILVDDQSDQSSVFSEGRVTGRTGNPSGERSYHLKPTTPGQESWSFDVVAKADGTAELYVTKAGARHLVCTLKK